MTWCVFVDEVEWNAYHDAECAARGIPRPGYNAANDTTVELQAQWTTSWVKPLAIWHDLSMHVIADVPPEDVVTYSLLELVNAPVFPTPDAPGDVTLDYAGVVWTVTPVEFVTEKQKPPTWVDPHDGKVYEVTP